MNKSQELMETYQKAQQQQQAEREQEQHEVSQEAERVLMESCKVWLDGLLDDFQLGEISANGNNWPHSFSIYLPFTWEGASGEVKMHWCSSNQYHLDHPTLYFHFKTVERRFANTSSAPSIRLELPCQGRGIFGRFFYMAPSGPVDPQELGKILVRVQAEVLERAELDQRDQAEIRRHEIDRKKNGFSYLNDDSLQAHWEQCMQDYPELGEEWDRRRSTRLAELEQERKQIAESVHLEAQLRAELNAERARMEKEAESKFEPCVIYRIDYGAHLGGEDEGREIYTSRAWVLDDKPDADGWYVSIYKGEIKRVKLPNIIRIEEIICLIPEELPGDQWDSPFVSATIRSETFPHDICVDYWVIDPAIKRLSPVGNA